ncbi:MAG: hypothetical protein ACRENE_12225 [Polyangiaceae bacterium]
MDTKPGEMSPYSVDPESGTRTCSAPRQGPFSGTRTREEVMASIEHGLREAAGVEELAVLVPLRSGWMPIWATGAPTPEMAAQALRARPGGIREPIVVLSLRADGRPIANVMVLALDPSRQGAFDVEALRAFIDEAALALRRAFDAERPTLRPTAMR